MRKTLICTVALAVLTGAMLLPFGIPEGISDKAVHFTAFLILGALMISYGGRRGALLALLCALIIECVQPLTGRTFENTDVIANATGVMTAWICRKRCLQK